MEGCESRSLSNDRTAVSRERTRGTVAMAVAVAVAVAMVEVVVVLVVCGAAADEEGAVSVGDKLSHKLSQGRVMVGGAAIDSRDSTGNRETGNREAGSRGGSRGGCKWRTFTG